MARTGRGVGLAENLHVLYCALVSPIAGYLVQTTLTLLGVLLVGGLVLYASRRWGAASPAGPLELVGRLPLEGRRALYLVRVADRWLVLGGSEAGLHKLTELDAIDLSPSQQDGASFRNVFERLTARHADLTGEGSKPPAPSDANGGERD